MEMSVLKLAGFIRTIATRSAAPYRKLFKRGYVEQQILDRKSETIHPYRQIHPWRSLTEFSDDLIRNVIYNGDGLIALNKPYGIAHRKAEKNKAKYFIPNAVEYTLQDALPYIAEKLNYSKLFVVRNPEKYMTGVTLLAADSRVQNNIELALRRGNNFTKTYWVVTTAMPNRLKGREKLGLVMSSDRQADRRKATITTSWSKNSWKRGDVKILNFDFKVLTNSTSNSCSLLEIRASSNKQHAIRLFAATFLYAPILGDNLNGSRIQQLGNTYVKVDPFLKLANLPPILDKNIYRLLDVQSSQPSIIPTHIHLKSIDLPSFIDKEDFKIEAPLMPPLDWTCRQLKLNYSSSIHG
ncbi:pseudouridylate synthase RPUSD4, mitochondrial [Halictus rubicundus]|uniref:pseudouridylate synthase RPUSD4, mitochondrial n=1 Tax=Halictus rubicundus TaxID=77578 RepID=UPI0040356EBF